MTAKTRYFVISSLLVLAVGLGTGLLAFYVGLPGGLLDRDGPSELQFIPAKAVVVAYADVREIMTSEVRQKIRRAAPGQENGQRRFQDETGIDIESDIDHVVASLVPGADGKTQGLVIARGRFSDVKIEALMRENGAEVADYGGKRIIAHHNPSGQGDEISLTFLEPGLIAVGSDQMVKAAIDLQKDGQNITGNAELMDLLRSLDRGNAWAIGRPDALASDGRLPERLVAQIPSIGWFAASGHVDSDVRGVIRVDARDDEAANNLRDVVRGFLALAKLQAGARPELQTVIQSLELGGQGKTVSVSFTIPGSVFDTLGSGANRAPSQSAH
jgi:hypothetical protein